MITCKYAQAQLKFLQINETFTKTHQNIPAYTVQNIMLGLASYKAKNHTHYGKTTPIHTYANFYLPVCPSLSKSVTIGKGLNKIKIEIKNNTLHISLQFLILRRVLRGNFGWCNSPLPRPLKWLLLRTI